MNTIKQVMEKGTLILKSEQIESPILKARLIMQYVLNKPRQYIVVYDQKELDKKEEEKYLKYIEKIKNGVPIQHITHIQEFMKMNFFVNEKVLIPRPDTECLVEEVIEIAKKTGYKKILDLCTGSGVVAISLAKYIKNSEITATDISKEALEIAKRNAIQNKVENQITYIKSDLFTQINEEKYDIIVSNPPYIKREIINKLDEEVKREPKIALDGGYDGLDFYRKIVNEADKYLKSKGYLCFEIGYDQKEEVTDIVKYENKYKQIYSKTDLFDKDRIICAKLK